MRCVLRVVCVARAHGRAQYVQPAECSEEDLLVVHTPQYLSSLKQSETVARVTEMLVLAYLPNSLLQQRVLRPMRLMVSGTIVSAFLAYALKAAHPEPTYRAFSINMGGGMHHAHSGNGGGWCVYSDIVLAVRHLRTAMDEPQLRVMVVDLDVHQGNGIARDKLKFEDSNLFIVDVYNRFIYPQDTMAYAGIDVSEPIGMHEKDASYLATVRRALERAFAAFTPDLLIYNAGTDVLAGDPLGMTDVTPAAVVERDELVFREAFDRNVPVSMLLSGGYTKPLSARVIADSICNLYAKFELDNVTLDGVL